MCCAMILFICTYDRNKRRAKKLKRKTELVRLEEENEALKGQLVDIKRKRESLDAAENLIFKSE